MSTCLNVRRLTTTTLPCICTDIQSLSIHEITYDLNCKIEGINCNKDQTQHTAAFGVPHSVERGQND
jgi:hypothetical protein